MESDHRGRGIDAVLPHDEKLAEEALLGYRVLRARTSSRSGFDEEVRRQSRTGSRAARQESVICSAYFLLGPSERG